MPLDGRYCADALIHRITEEAAVATRAENDAREAARTLATAAERREDNRVMLEFGSLATGQSHRARRAKEEVETLIAFKARGIPVYRRDVPIGLGAVVDIANEESDGVDERTYVLLPVGAGTELAGPGGDGFLSVITPSSPVGKALMGRRCGDTVDVTIRGEVSAWRILDVC